MTVESASDTEITEGTVEPAPLEAPERQERRRPLPSLGRLRLVEGFGFPQRLSFWRRIWERAGFVSLRLAQNSSLTARTLPVSALLETSFMNSRYLDRNPFASSVLDTSVFKSSSHCVRWDSAESQCSACLSRKTDDLHNESYIKVPSRTGSPEEDMLSRWSNRRGVIA